jgi:hypothetical protein
MRTADGPKNCSGVYYKEGGKGETIKICEVVAEKRWRKNKVQILEWFGCKS